VNKTASFLTSWWRGRSTSRLGWRILQLTGAVLLAGSAASALALSGAGPAGASPCGSSPTNGCTLSGATVPVGTVTADTPFSSGQDINVVVPANSILPVHAAVFILECEAPGGVDPTDTSACDGNTVQGNTVLPASDGSINLQTQKYGLYPVYALPDQVTFNENPSGYPDCNLTTECVLYIGDDQSDFTQPHFWSEPFYVAPNSDDLGENPGDGSAPPPPTVPSAALSTLTAASPSVQADGEDPGTITATLLATGGVPVSGRSVTLSQGDGQSDIVPSSAVTNSDGVATFTVTDATAEQVTYTATDTTDSISISQTASVDFAVPAVSPVHSSIDASPTSLPADGLTTTTITVTLRDEAADPQPLSNRTVTLSQGSGHSTITYAPGANVTNAQGVATFTATDTTPEIVTYGATDRTDGVTLSGSAQVTFGTLTVSGAASTVTAVSPAPVGGFGTSVTVTLRTANSTPVAGKTVALTANSATATETPASPGSNVTDSTGQATFTVVDTTAETVIFSATDTTDSNLAIAQTATVVFEPSAASATNSTVTESASSTPADGQSSITIEVVVKDQFGNALDGQTVSVEGTSNAPAGCSGESVEIHPFAIGSSAPGVTNSSGEAQFIATDTTAQTVTFSATDSTDSLPIYDTVEATYTAGPADGTVSTVTSSPSKVPSNGTTPSTVTVTLTDHFCNPIAGKKITLTALGGSSEIVPAESPNVTGPNGEATFNVADATPEVVTYFATDTTDGLLLSSQAVVTFGSPPLPPPAPADCDVAASTKNVVANGSSSATIAVYLYDTAGNPVPGQAVTLTPSGGSSVVTAMTGGSGNERVRGSIVTDQSATNGEALFYVSDKSAQSVTYTATDTTQSPPLVVGQGVTIVFTAAPATGTTTTTSPVKGTAPTTTTTTTRATTTTTSTAIPPASSSGGSGDSFGGSSGSSDPGTASSAGSAGTSLAFTGAPTLLPWLLGFGVLFLVLGTLGRRLTAWRSR
jgi:hypothetical protein